jgi:hypothetical protein
VAEYALSNAPYPGVNTPYQRGVLLPVVVSFAAGAPAIVEARSSSGFTIADGASGAYTGTAPIGTRGIAWTQLLRAVDADSARVDFVSYDPVTGAFTLQAYVNDAPADIDDADELWLFFMIEGG